MARIFPILLAALVLAPLTGPAALIAQQSYNGTPSGWFTSTPFESPGSAQPGLSYSTLAVSGSARQITNDSSQSLTGGASLSDTGQFYFAFLMNNNGNTHKYAMMTLFASFFHDGNGPGGGTELVSFGQNDAGDIVFISGNYGSGSPIFSTYDTGIDASSGTHLFVIGWNTNAGTDQASFSFWYDPLTSVESPLAAYASGTPGFSVNLPSFHYEFARIGGQSNATWDELRIGDTFADVTPGLPVPEPSAVLLTGAGLAFLLWRRKARLA